MEDEKGGTKNKGKTVEERLFSELCVCVCVEIPKMRCDRRTGIGMILLFVRSNGPSTPDVL